MEKGYMTIEEAAEKSNLSTLTIRREIKRGMLSFARYGRKMVIKESDFYQWAVKRKMIINK